MAMYNPAFAAGYDNFGRPYWPNQMSNGAVYNQSLPHQSYSYGQSLDASTHSTASSSEPSNQMTLYNPSQGHAMAQQQQQQQQQRRQLARRGASSDQSLDGSNGSNSNRAGHDRRAQNIGYGLSMVPADQDAANQNMAYGAQNNQSANDQMTAFSPSSQRQVVNYNNYNNQPIDGSSHSLTAYNHYGNESALMAPHNNMVFDPSTQRYIMPQHGQQYGAMGGGGQNYPYGSQDQSRGTQDQSHGSAGTYVGSFATMAHDAMMAAYDDFRSGATKSKYWTMITAKVAEKMQDVMQTGRFDVMGPASLPGASSGLSQLVSVVVPALNAVLICSFAKGKPSLVGSRPYTPQGGPMW